MTQESTMICVDNSEWMRNGDLPPTRFNCQQEAVRALIHHKLRNNPENAVGLLSLADHIDVLNSLTTDNTKLMVRLHSLEILGVSKVFDGIKTAYLALKHRKNRNHRQRIVLFIGSPLDPLLSEKESFMKFSKKLKKEKVSVDFVLFGEATAENHQIIADFVDTLNGSEQDGSSHLLVVPIGDTKLYDALLRSPICAGAAVGGAAGTGAFGINEEDDPELAMALRISLDEQRLGQQQGTAEGQQQQNALVAMEVDQQQQQQSDNVCQAVPGEGAQQSEQQEVPDLSTMTEAEQLEYVLQLSMAGNQPTQGTHDGQQNQQQRSRSSSGAMSTPAPTPMEVEEGAAGSNNAQGVSGGGGGQMGDLMQLPEMLRQLVGQVVPVDSTEGTSKGAGRQTTVLPDQPKEDKEVEEKDGGAMKETERKNDKKGNSKEK